MNLVTVHHPALMSRLIVTLIALGIIAVVAAIPASAEVPADVQRAANTTVAGEPAKVTPSTKAATPITPLPALAAAESDDAAKLQAARIRYGRLAQNFPNQLKDLDDRAKEIAEVLRESLPEPTGTPPAATTTAPSKPVRFNPPVTTAPTAPPSSARPPTTTTGSSTAVGSDIPPVEKAAAPQPWSVHMTVTDLIALARRLDQEADLARGLTEHSFDGKRVSLHPDTAARLQALDKLLREKEAATNRTGVHPSPGGTKSDGASNYRAGSYQYDR